MPWTVAFHPEFEQEYETLCRAVQDELLARLRVLTEFGPNLGRPSVDTLYGSHVPNMKELRFQTDGVWRFAFVFDPTQTAIVLVGGDKQGQSQKKFYKRLIKIAERRYSMHLGRIKEKDS